MPAKEDHDALSQMAEWLGLKDNEAENFVNEGMKRKGHKQMSVWADNDENGGDGKKEGGFFGGGGATKKAWSPYGDK